MWMGVVLQTAAFSALLERWKLMLTGAGEALLNLLVAIVVGLVAWGLARLASSITLRLLRALHFNDAVRRLMTDTARPPRFEPAALASWGVYWTLLLLGVMAMADVLGFDLTPAVGARLRETLPSVLSATIELIVGITLAMLLGAITRRLFESAGFRGSHLRGQIVTIVVSAFAVLLALEQLGLAAQFIMALGITAVAAAGIAVALAFGLGCRELARDFIVEYLRSLDDEAAGRPR
jgi:hypothetical protein